MPAGGSTTSPRLAPLIPQFVADIGGRLREIDMTRTEIAGQDAALVAEREQLSAVLELLDPDTASLNGSGGNGRGEEATTIADLVLAAIDAYGPTLTVPELVEYTGKKEGSIRGVLTELKKAGILVNDAGTWGRPDPAE